MKRVCFLMIFGVLMLLGSTAVAQNQIVMFKSHANPKHDVAKLKNTSLTQCSNLCKKRSDCALFEHNAWTNTCWLKNKVAAHFGNWWIIKARHGFYRGKKQEGAKYSADDTKLTLGIKLSNLQFTKFNKLKQNMRTNKDAPSNDVAVYQGIHKKPRLCAALCARDNRCKAFTYHASKKKCWLKNKKGKVINKGDRVYSAM